MGNPEIFNKLMIYVSLLKAIGAFFMVVGFAISVITYLFFLLCLLKSSITPLSIDHCSQLVNFLARANVEGSEKGPA